MTTKRSAVKDDQTVENFDLVMENGDVITVEITYTDYDNEVEPIWNEIKDSIKQGNLWWVGNWLNVKTYINDMGDSLSYINCKKVNAVR